MKITDIARPTKHSGGLNGQTEYLKLVIPLLYADNSFLTPFLHGDRASMLGKESAEAFAKRKWAEQAKLDATQPMRLTGPGTRGCMQRHGPDGRPITRAEHAAAQCPVNVGRSTNDTLRERTAKEQGWQLP